MKMVRIVARADPAIMPLMYALGQACAEWEKVAVFNVVIARVTQSGRWIAFDPRGDGTFWVTLAPYAELAIREALMIAEQPGWSEAMALRSLDEALTWAGF